MKKNLSKLISFLLSLVILFTLTISSTSAQSVYSKDQLEVYIYESMIQYEGKGQLQISDIKTIKDFAGNKYTIIECEPNGYFVYHNTSGKFIEFAIESISPYKSYSKNLYYAGPTQYYIKNGNEYQHLIDKNKIIDESTAQDFVNTCNVVEKKLYDSKNQKILDFINQKITFNKSSSILIQESSNIISPQLVTYQYIPNYTYISTLTQFGENIYGTCGYIAAIIVLYYWQRRMPSQWIIHPSWYNSTGLVGNILHDYLLYYGNYQADTIATDIMNVLNIYCNIQIVNAQAGWWLFATGSAVELSSGRPFILFGSLYSPPDGYNVNHAVVVYGTEIVSAGSGSTTRFIAHYGWTGYTHVVVADSSWFGTMTTFVPN